MKINSKEGRVEVYKDYEFSEYCIHDLWVEPEFRRNGFGTKLIIQAMALIYDDMEKHNTFHYRVCLKSKPFDDSITPTQLECFYSNLGFKKLGHDKNRRETEMEYPPLTKKTPIQHIIHHVDNDGYGSAMVVLEYLKSQQLDTSIKSMRYNYGDDTISITKSLDETTGPIYVVDVTLPDEIMSKYAERIIWIDHHKHILDTIDTKEWATRLQLNASKTHITPEEIPLKFQYYVDDMTPSTQISACELSWLTLFPEKMIPYWVSLIGRYDVWDHHNADNILYFKAGMGDLTVELESRYRDNNTTYILPELYANITQVELVIELGEFIAKAKKLVYKQQAIRCVTKQTFLSKYKVMVANAPAFTSLFFDAVVTEDVDVLMVYNYNATQKSWALSCYGNSLNKNRPSALEVITALGEITGCKYGGHADACGITLTDIKTQFLDFLDPLY